MSNAFEKGVKWVSGKADTVDHYFDSTDHSLQAWSNIQSRHLGEKGKVNRHKGVKEFAKKSMTVAKKGISVAQMATGQSGAMGLAKNAALGASVGLSATGVGLLVTSSTFAVINSGLAIKSARSTHLHIRGLEKISEVKSKLSCDSCEGVSKNGSDHDLIATTILPAIISKKKLKRVRKGVSGVPIVGGMLASAHSAKNGLVKRWNGNRGEKRHFHAEVLARHLVTHQCELAHSIVAELFSHDEALEMMKMSTNKAGPLICSKMRST
jgi:hypothetical protein